MGTDELRISLESAISGIKSQALSQYVLCDPCIGRLFAKVGKGFENRERGAFVRQITGIKPLEGDCCLCKGLASRVDFFSELAIESFAGWEYSTFLVGTKFEPEITAAEENIWAETGASQTEPLKAEMNREIGKLIEKKTGKIAEFGKPDIMAVIDTTYESVEIQVASAYIYGRYTKLSREIPQTRWPCRECQGKGCPRCNETGKMYADSVEEFIGRVAVRHAQGKDHRFHGMGREDIDALMLGTGRPFILEVKDPRIRTFDYEMLQKEVNSSTDKVQVSGLRHSDGTEVVRIKAARPMKSYRATVAFATPVDEENLKEVVVSLGGTNISQQTPNRVMHRRADLERGRKVVKIEVKLLNPTEAVFDITAEAGTYIKEFIHGDGGRTVPSVSGELGVACEVRALDVLNIMDDG